MCRLWFILREGYRMANYLFKLAQAKKAPDSDLIASMSKLSDILLDRKMSNPNFDLDAIYRDLFADDCFNDAKNIRSVFAINDALIAIPAIPPQRGSDGMRKNGNHVIPVIELPGENGEMYQAYIPGTPTWVDTDSINLRGPRQIHIHRVIPGMIVTFHHYSTVMGDSNRVEVLPYKVFYDDNGRIAMKALDEKFGMYNLPNEEDVKKKVAS